MDCTRAHELLNERIGGLLEQRTAEALDLHLDHCSHCRELARELADLESLLRAALPAPLRSAAVAGQAVARMEELDSGIAHRSRRARIALIAAIGSLAAAWLLVVAIIPHPRMADDAPEPLRPAEPRFNVTLAKGTVEVRRPSAEQWDLVNLPAESAQPLGTALRTAPDGLCEFRCPSGGVVRVDSNSEVTLVGDDEVTFRRGRLWCQAPQQKSLTVVAEAPEPADSMWATVSCQTDSQAQTAIRDPSTIRVLVGAGTVDVRTQAHDVRLQQGSVLVLNPQGTDTYDAGDALEEGAWMTPLLAMRGGRNREFSDLVTHILSQVGRSKVANLYEQQLQDLGAPGALPLVAYLKSGEGDSESRQTAARVIQQTASEESLVDLVGLLGDRDADVRVASATALERLTGLTQGAPPETWRFSGAAQTQALKAWRAWLKETGRDS